MSEFSACRFLITRFLYAGFYCKEFINNELSILLNERLRILPMSVVKPNFVPHIFGQRVGSI